MPVGAFPPAQLPRRTGLRAEKRLRRPDRGEDAFRAQADARVAQFVEAMDDDLNTADGIAALFELARDCNTFFGTTPARRDR